MRKSLPKIILVSSFLFALLLVVFMNYGQTEQVEVHAKTFEPKPSDNCVTCHTSAETITALAKSDTASAGGG